MDSSNSSNTYQSIDQKISELEFRISRTVEISQMLHFTRTYTCACHSNRYTGPHSCCDCKFEKVRQEDLDRWARVYTDPLHKQLYELLTLREKVSYEEEVQAAVELLKLRQHPQSGKIDCMMDALTEVFEAEAASPATQNDEWDDSLMAVIPPDIDDDFINAVQLIDSMHENPLSFFESVGGHLEEHTVAYYWDECLTIEVTSSMRQYIDALELTYPHLKEDILTYILWWTKEPTVARPWDTRYSIVELVMEARKHFQLFAANHITARLRMGFDDRVHPQAGVTVNIMKGLKKLVKGNEAAVRYGAEMAVCAEWPGITALMENIGLFIMDWRSSTTSTGCIISIYRFLKNQFGFSLSAGIAQFIITAIEELKLNLDDVQEVYNDGQGQEPQAGFAEFLDGYKSVTRSGVFEKLSKLAMLIGSLAMGYFTGSTLTASKFADICKHIYSGMVATDILGQIMEAIQAIYKKCLPVLLGEADIASIWIGLGDGRQLDLDIVNFITVGSRYVDGTSNADDKLPDVLLIEAIGILKKLNDMLASTKDAASRSHIKRTILQVEGVRQGVCNRHNNAGMRIAPIFFAINGKSGSGKTACLLELIAALQISENLPAGPKYVFRMDDQDSYQSGLNSQHNTYIIDDYGNTKPQFAKVVPTDVIIQLANNCPKFAVMADLAAKGAVPMKPHFLLLTTNVKHLHAETYSECKDSILRRPHLHITMDVRPQFADGEGKLREDVNPVEHDNDCWLFTVQQYLPSHRDSVEGFVTVKDNGVDMVGVDFVTLLRYCVKKSKAHHARQRAYIDHSNNVHKVARCKCGVPANLCKGCEYTMDDMAPQAGFFQPEVRLASAYMGYRDVMQAPFGRDLVKDRVRPLYMSTGVVTAIAMAICHLTNTLWWPVMFWFLQVLVLAGVSAYRILTYRITLDVQPVAQHCVAVVRDQLLGPKAKVVAALVAAAGMYKVYRWANQQSPQGSTPSRPRVNIEVGKVPDLWRRTEMTPMPKNDEMITATGKQLADVLSSKICTVSVFTDTVHKYSAAIPVVTNFWLVPHHLIDSPYEKVRIQHAGEDVINYAHTAIREGAYRRVGTTDFALLYMPGKGDQRNLLKFFPESTHANESCRYVEKPCRLVLLEQEVVKSPDGEKNIQVPKRSVHGIRVSSNWVSPHGVERYWGGSYTSPVDTFTGMCGSVIVSEGNGPYIVGLHSAGIHGKKVASYCTVTRDDLVKCIADMTSPEEPMMQGSDEGPMNLDFEQMPYVEALPKDTHFDYMENAEVDLVGCHAGRKRRYTTMVRPTDYSDTVEEKFGVGRKHGPPALMNHWYPGRLWAESCANSKPMSMYALRYAFRNFRKKIFDHLRKHEDDKQDICVLEDIVNTSGLDGVKGLFKMNLNASAGIPYCKPKKDYVKASDDFFDGITVPYELTDEMKADVKILEDIYKSGARGYAPHRANRKDEAIKIGKAKVRIFSGTSMPYLFLMRKYFLTISVYMQRHPEVFESAVGVNPYGYDWTKLYKYITKYGTTRIVAGDYEKYDQFVHSSLTYAAFKLLIQIAEWAGFDEEDLMVMRGLATDTCNPLYELDGLWLKFGGSSPSGHGLTVVLNGIVNSFYARMAWWELHPTAMVPVEPVADFNKHVAFMSYGDDNVMSVSEETPWFNHCTYQSALAKYGLNYTMADKTAESVPYIAMQDATFLKRTWVYSEQHGRYLAPLEEDSIFKMLHTFVVSKVSPKEQQLADILRSANQEFYMHGKTRFLDARDKLEQIASEYELKHYLPGGQLPSLEEMDSWYAEM